MVGAWKSLKKAIHKRGTSRNRADPDAGPDDASASVVRREELDDEPKKSGYIEPTRSAKTERSEKHGPFF